MESSCLVVVMQNFSGIRSVRLNVVGRDLSVDKRSTNGERARRHLLQPVLAVGPALRRRSAPPPGDEAHDGRRRRRATEPARPRHAWQQQRRRSGLRYQRTGRRRTACFNVTDVALVITVAIRPVDVANLSET